MEKKKKIVNKMNMMNCSENIEDTNKINDMRVYGFEDSMSVARSLMGSIHENLLKGDLIFAYRSTSSSNKTPLCQIVVVNELREENTGGMFRLVPTNLFSVSIITSGYTAYIPHMPIGYLDEITAELENGKAEKKIIETFKNIVEDLKTKWEEK
jgi:hypothetical protein